MQDDSAEYGELRRIAEVYAERDRRPGGHESAGPTAAGLAFIQQVELRLVRMLDRAGIVLEQSAVLDVGCGSGYYLNRLSEFGARRAVGIDLMPERVEAGRRRYPQLDLHAGSATELPFGDGEFELVTQFTCLSSVLDPVVRRRIAAEMSRVVQPDGLIISFDMRPAPTLLQLTRRLRRTAAPDGALLPLGRRDVAGLFPGTVIASEYPALHPAIIERVGARPAAVGVLSVLPVLRSHLLVAIRPF